MEIELKRISVNERMSEETTNFIADLYINGKHVGEAYNEGHGGPTSYRSNDKPSLKLIEETEEWCKTLPDKVYEKTQYFPSFSVKMTLEVYIGSLLDDYLLKKSMDKFERQRQNQMENSFVYGKPGDIEYAYLKYNRTLTEMKNFPVLRAKLLTTIKNRLLPKLEGDVKLLNNNILVEELVKLGIPKDKIEPAPLVLKKSSQKRTQEPPGQGIKKKKR